MYMDFYTQGFLEKLAAYEKAADYASTKKVRQEIIDDADRKAGIVKPDPYVEPKSFGEAVGQSFGRLGTHLHSLGRGLASGAVNLGIRGLQGYLDFKTFIPRLADKLIFGKLLGIDEGRGLFGRAYGKLERLADEGVHGVRKWSSDFDEKHRINGGFNRFINGAAADALGSFVGWGGLKRGLFNKAMAGFGAYGALGSDSQAGQLRKREAWIRSLDPRDRLRVDPTSTAYNQENAPTTAEYKRYHLPSYGLPTSSTGRIKIPYSWMHQSNGSLVNFRDFGT